MKNILERIKSERLYFDGGTGTVLQKSGLKDGEAPEVMNHRSPDVVKSLHIEYISAGADIIKTNTFGISSLKYIFNIFFIFSFKKIIIRKHQDVCFNFFSLCYYKVTDLKYYESTWMFALAVVCVCKRER